MVSQVLDQQKKHAQETLPTLYYTKVFDSQREVLALSRPCKFDTKILSLVCLIGLIA